jgi:hypothetical protein
MFTQFVLYSLMDEKNEHSLTTWEENFISYCHTNLQLVMRLGSFRMTLKQNIRAWTDEWNHHRDPRSLQKLRIKQCWPIVYINNN